MTLASHLNHDDIHVRLTDESQSDLQVQTLKDSARILCSNFLIYRSNSF